MVTKLNEYELRLVTDAEVLLVKNKIIQKVYDLFGRLAIVYKHEVEAKSGLSQIQTTAKISRGENYLGLPYVMLDYPREFTRNDVFAIRSFFWWGNFFSITIQLSGKYKLEFATSLQRKLEDQAFKDWYIGQSSNPWQHHFKEDNYRPILANEDLDIVDLPFIKIAKKIPLTEWDRAEIFFTENFRFILNTLKP